MCRTESGFSLTELLVVIMILGIAATVAIPNLSTTDMNKLELAAEEFAQAMRFARSEAIRTGEPRGFRQRSTNIRSISVFRPDTSTDPWTLEYDVYHPISKKLYTVDLYNHPFAQVDGMTHVKEYRGSCDTPANIYFNASGVPYCADPDNLLLDKFEITFTLGTQSRLLILDSITGRVTVQ